MAASAVIEGVKASQIWGAIISRCNSLDGADVAAFDPGDGLRVAVLVSISKAAFRAGHDIDPIVTDELAASMSDFINAKASNNGSTEAVRLQYAKEIQVAVHDEAHGVDERHFPVSYTFTVAI